MKSKNEASAFSIATTGTPAETKSTFLVITGSPALYFVGGVLPKIGQKVEWICTGSSEAEVEIQLQAAQE